MLRYRCRSLLVALAFDAFTNAVDAAWGYHDQHFEYLLTS